MTIWYSTLTAARVLELRAQSAQFEDDLNTLPMGGFAVLDASADARLYGALSLHADAQNLLNARYLVGRAGVDTIGPPPHRHGRRPPAVALNRRSPP